MRYLLRVEVLVDRRIRWRAERAEHQQDFLLLYEPARLLDRPRWTVAIIEADQVDLPPTDSALLVEHPEVSGFSPPQRGPCRDGSAVGHRLSDLDRRIRYPGPVLLVG